jgi:hypothetical protein
LRPSVHAIPINSRIATDTQTAVWGAKLIEDIRANIPAQRDITDTEQAMYNDHPQTNSVLSIYSCRK